jgi:hypothetical protein
MRRDLFNGRRADGSRRGWWAQAFKTHLVESEGERLVDPLAPGRRNQIYLYDDRNRERIPEDA